MKNQSSTQKDLAAIKSRAVAAMAQRLKTDGVTVTEEWVKDFYSMVFAPHIQTFIELTLSVAESQDHIDLAYAASAFAAQATATLGLAQADQQPRQST